MTYASRHGYDMTHYAQEPQQWAPPAGEPATWPQAQTTAAPQPPTSNRWATLVVGIAIGAAVTAGAIFGAQHIGGGGGTPTIAVHGMLQLNSTTSITYGAANGDSGSTECEGSGGYSDLAPGVNVVITDDTGQTLTTVPLGSGSTVKSGVTSGYCDFPFDTTVPAGHKTYGVTIGHRGTIVFTPDKIAKPQLSIGS